MLIVYPVGGPPTISKKSPVIKNLSPGMDCIDYEGFMTLFAAALLKHSAGCAQAGQGRNDQQRIGHIVAGLGNVCRNSRRGRCCGRLCRGGRGCGGGSRRRYRRDRSDGGGRCRGSFRGRRGGAFLPAVVAAVAAAGTATVAAAVAAVAGIIGACGNVFNHSGQGDGQGVLFIVCQCCKVLCTEGA